MVDAVGQLGGSPGAGGRDRHLRPERDVDLVRVRVRVGLRVGYGLG